MHQSIPRQISVGRPGRAHPVSSTLSRDEDGEGLRAVVIPHDDQSPVRIETITGSPLAAVQRLVHGSARTLRLGQPAATVYVNEEGGARGLPVNFRAAMLGQAHRAFTLSGEPCDARLFVGDVVLLGPATGDGRDTSAPRELLDLFSHPGQFRIEVTVYTEPGRWYGNDRRFDDVSDAYASALSLARRWVLVQDLRMVPAVTDATPAEVPLPQATDENSGDEAQPGQGEPS